MRKGCESQRITVFFSFHIHRTELAESDFKVTDERKKNKFEREQEGRES